MFILQESGLLGSGPTGPGSGYSRMARIFGKTAYTCRISLIAGMLACRIQEQPKREEYNGLTEWI